MQTFIRFFPSTIRPILFSLLTYSVFKLVRSFFSYPSNQINGPRSPSFLWGSLKEVLKDKPGKAHARWCKIYGRTFVHAGMLGERLVFSLDPKLLNHVLTRSDIYHKSPSMRFSFGRATGEGLLMVDGETHRRQRKVLNPAFGPAQIRDLTYIFLDKAYQLRDIWANEIVNQNGVATLDVNPVLGRLTLDVIALAGFDCDLDTLNPDTEPTELSEAVNVLITTGTTVDALSLLRSRFPILRLIPSSSDRKIGAARAVVLRKASELINTSRLSFLEECKGSQAPSAGKNKDLLSLLVKESLNTEDRDNRMSDDHIKFQVPTFIIAGNDTTSAAAAWVLHALSVDPVVQTKLRSELRAVTTDRPTMDELNALPYLENVIRESLRLYCPVTSAPRVAIADDVIPLTNPIAGRQMDILNEIHVEKGDVMFIPIFLINMDVTFWGEDAAKFKPERWDNLPPTVTQIPGLWSHLLSFLGGPRSCIGFRFALTELKAILFVLIRAFEVEPAVSPSDIVSLSTTAIKKPTYLGAEKGAVQLPLRLREVSDR